LESQLRQAQKLEAVGQLAGGVAHDFNNILAAMMMHLGLLQMNAALDAETQQALKELDAQTRRAAALTRQLLMFSRRSVLAVRPLDLNEVVANLLKMLSRLIGEQIELRFDGMAGLPPVGADAGMLEQVLMNLVVNARDAMPKGGCITIRTRCEDLGGRDIRLNPNRRSGRFVSLAVADTGTGMEEATLKRIFEPFFTTKEAGKGTGLGLATVHGIVAQHRGWVEVESAPGQGTTFRVFLPSMVEATEPVAPVAPREELRRGRETVLLVEDDAKVRRSVCQALQALGYRVYEAANGQDAVRLWQEVGVQVQLLLTDMVMPEGMTGLELVESLQALKPGLKAIISSGYSAEIVQAGVPSEKGIVYLPKPYATKTLAEIVRQCLDDPS
jgi:CheY-like chemotaxis protein